MDNGSPPSRAGATTPNDLSPKKGLTLAQLIDYIELFTQHKVITIYSGDTKHSLLVYRQNSPTLANEGYLNLLFGEAVDLREENALKEARDKSALSVELGSLSYSPKKAERDGNVIKYCASCDDDKTYSGQWEP
ncbi:hypothetical protein ACQ4LE_002094 [Meloidogyne hapla]